MPGDRNRPAGNGPVGMQATATTTAALATVSRGWSIFPVLPNDKRPAINDWPNRATRNPDIIARQWPGDHNVGIACEPSGLVVVDLDCGKPLPPPWDAMPGVVDGQDVLAVVCEQHDPEWPSWPDWRSTYTVQTPSSGWHLCFKATSGAIRNSSGKLGPLIDIRAAGGYVVGAGSVVNGRAYELVIDGDPRPLPEWMSRLLLTRPKAEPRPLATLLSQLSKPVMHGDRYVTAALTNELNAVKAAPQGQRNEQLNRSAFAVGRFVAAGQLDGSHAAAALLEAGLCAGLTETESIKTIRSAFTAQETLL
jgi:Bifunctional DNA primase/polymerase, N-terminal